MSNLINDSQIRQILLPPNADTQWQATVDSWSTNFIPINRLSRDEYAIKSIQRLLIFLGYSTTATGSYSVDGDFGRGTNRGIAQFQFEHHLNTQLITRDILAYQCTWQTAKTKIKIIPAITLDVATFEKMLAVAKENIETNQVNCGSFDEAIFQLNAVYNRTYLFTNTINQKYGALAEEVSHQLSQHGKIVLPDWILTIINVETNGVVRPKFEQQILYRENQKTPDISLTELRYQSTSYGLGQIMGFNYKRVKATSAKALYNLPLKGQIEAVGMFLATASKNVRAAVAKSNPTINDFQTVARYYNGSGYHKNQYDEKMNNAFYKFKHIRS